MKARKPTTRTTLPPAEWAFHKVPPAEWEAVALYEYEREAAAWLEEVPDTIGHPLADALRGQLHTDANTVDLAMKIYWFCAKDNKHTPLPPQCAWLDLSKKQRAEILRNVDYRRRMEREHTLSPLVEIPGPGAVPPPPEFIEEVSFNVDWRASDDVLRTAFAAWLDKAHKGKRADQWRPAKNRTGPSPLLAALTDLVLMRGRRAGMTLQQTADLMSPFLRAANATSKAYSPIQRARACRQAEDRIRVVGYGWFLGMDRMRALLHRVTGEAPPVDYFLFAHRVELESWVNAKRATGHLIPEGNLFEWERTGALDRLNSPDLTKLRKRNRGK